MSAIEINSLYRFSTFIEKLKKMERFKGQYYWKDYPALQRYESVADHTWRLGILVLLFADKLQKKFSLEKALKIVLVHDLPEILAGDESPMGNDGTGKNTHAYNVDLQKEKLKNEKSAATELFSLLGENDSKLFYNLWLEYEEQKSYESKIVKSLDKIECMLQVLEYQKGVLFKAHLDFTIDYGMKYADIDPAIKAYGEKIVLELQQKFVEYNKETLTDS